MTVISGFSNYLETEVLNHVFRNTAYTASAVVYLGLSTGAGPSEEESPTTELPNANGYTARLAITFDPPTEVTPSAMQIVGHNSTTLDFTSSGSGWGSITGFIICESATVGTLDVIAGGLLDTARTVNVGDTLQFAIDAVAVTLR